MGAFIGACWVSSTRHDIIVADCLRGVLNDAVLQVEFDLGFILS
jgi:hypothetical protein